jgi:hypothetical protein
MVLHKRQKAIARLLPAGRKGRVCGAVSQEGIGVAARLSALTCGAKWIYFSLRSSPQMELRFTGHRDRQKYAILFAQAVRASDSC